MTPSLSYTSLPIFCTNGNKVVYDSTIQSIGYQPQQQLPCEYYNYLENGTTNNLQVLESGMTSVLAELTTLLTAASITASGSSSVQLKAALDTLYQAHANGSVWASGLATALSATLLGVLSSGLGTNWPLAVTTSLGTNWSSALAEALSQAHVPSSSAALSIDSSWNAPLSNTYKQVTAGDYVVPGCGNPLRFDTSGNPLLSYYSGSSAQLYVKVLEIKSPVTGTVRAKYSVSNGYNYQSYIRVYINGTAVGTEHPFTSSTYFHDDISVSMGDLVQLYMYSVTTQIMRVAGFALCCAEEGERYIQ